MADDFLIAIDRALAQPTMKRSRRRLVDKLQPPVLPGEPDLEAAEAPASGVRAWLPWVELFLVVQFMWGALLFIPGAQAYRPFVRALPYASSLGLLALYFLQTRSGRRPRGSGLLVCALLLLVVNLLHPTSQFAAGLAQCVFQLCIAAPMFWAHKAVHSPRRLERVLLLVFVMNFASAALGVLQVYYPDRFMPPRFSAQLSEGYLDSLSYYGSDGRVIFRPPGLSDQPGGAAVAAGLTVLLGLGLNLGVATPLARVAAVAGVVVGFAVIYLTQVRSVLLMVVGGGAMLSLIAIRQRRIAAGFWNIAIGGTLVVAAFLWASSVGGDSVSQRFLSLGETGVLQTYQQNRGHYLSDTVGGLLDRFPLGAGVGRWGMMNTYFGDSSDPSSAPLYVEPQVTGWLLDGGIPMWILYGGAVLLTLLAGFTLAGSREPAVANLAAIVCPLLIFIAGLGMAGPVFNTQLGILFWMLAAALHGVHNGVNQDAGPASISEGQNSRNFEAEETETTRA